MSEFGEGPTYEEMLDRAVFAGFQHGFAAGRGANVPELQAAEGRKQAAQAEAVKAAIELVAKAHLDGVREGKYGGNT